MITKKINEGFWDSMAKAMGANDTADAITAYNKAKSSKVSPEQNKTPAPDTAPTTDNQPVQNKQTADIFSNPSQFLQAFEKWKQTNPPAEQVEQTKKIFSQMTKDSGLAESKNIRTLLNSNKQITNEVISTFAPNRQKLYEGLDSKSARSMLIYENMGHTLREAAETLSIQQINNIFNQVEKDLKVGGAGIASNRNWVGKAKDLYDAVKDGIAEVGKSIDQTKTAQDIDRAIQQFLGAVPKDVNQSQLNGIQKFFMGWKKYNQDHPVLSGFIYSVIVMASGVGVALAGASGAWLLLVPGLLQTVNRLIMGDTLSKSLAKGAWAAAKAETSKLLFSWLKDAWPQMKEAFTSNPEAANTVNPTAVTQATNTIDAQHAGATVGADGAHQRAGDAAGRVAGQQAVTSQPVATFNPNQGGAVAGDGQVVQEPSTSTRYSNDGSSTTSTNFRGQGPIMTGDEYNNAGMSSPVQSQSWEPGQGPKISDEEYRQMYGRAPVVDNGFQTAQPVSNPTATQLPQNGAPQGTVNPTPTAGAQPVQNPIGAVQPVQNPTGVAQPVQNPTAPIGNPTGVQAGGGGIQQPIDPNSIELPKNYLQSQTYKDLVNQMAQDHPKSDESAVKRFAREAYKQALAKTGGIDSALTPPPDVAPTDTTAPKYTPPPTNGGNIIDADAKNGINKGVAGKLGESLTESQIAAIFYRIELKERAKQYVAEGEKWDKFKDKAGSAVGNMFNDTTNKVTANKLQKAWQGAGQPTTPDKLIQFLVKQKVNRAVAEKAVQQVASNNQSQPVDIEFNPQQLAQAWQQHKQSGGQIAPELKQTIQKIASDPIFNQPQSQQGNTQSTVAPPGTSYGQQAQPAQQLPPGQKQGWDNPQASNYVGRREVARLQAAQKAQKPSYGGNSNYTMGKSNVPMGVQLPNSQQAQPAASPAKTTVTNKTPGIKPEDLKGQTIKFGKDKPMTSQQWDQANKKAVAAESIIEDLLFGDQQLSEDTAFKAVRALANINLIESKITTRCIAIDKLYRDSISESELKVGGELPDVSYENIRLPSSLRPAKMVKTCILSI